MGKKKHRRVYPSQLEIGNKVPMGPSDYWTILALEKEQDGQTLIRFAEKPEGARAPASMRILVLNEDPADTP